MLLSSIASTLRNPATYIVAGTPVVWAVLTLVHPFTFEELAEDGRTTRWLFVHFAQLPLTVLLSLVLLAVLAPMAGKAALLARVGTIVWAVLFSAFDSVAGIATGMLVHGGYIDAAAYLFDHDVVGGDFSVLSIIAHPTWVIVAVAAGLAIRANGGRMLSQVTMYLSLPFAVSHVGPFATIALLSLAVSLVTARASSTEPVSESTAAG